MRYRARGGRVGDAVGRGYPVRVRLLDRGVGVLDLRCREVGR